jgi:hypothetical protein
VLPGRLIRRAPLRPIRGWDGAASILIPERREGTMKLKLKIGDLRVESFRTADEAAPARGTVRGHENTVLNCASDDPTCPLACDPGTTGTCIPGWTEAWTDPCCD